MKKTFFGIPGEKVINLLAAFACAAVGMALLCAALEGLILNSGYQLFPLGLSPLKYSAAGFGLFFIVMGLFFLRETFNCGFFHPESLTKDGLTFSAGLILFWLVLYCLDYLIPLTLTFFHVLFSRGS
ncbi:MAG: hypothetical protein Q7T80_09340 [Methanoregula sp.]|nr:hypothetical protein [Methanoregula sp.]